MINIIHRSCLAHVVGESFSKGTLAKFVGEHFPLRIIYIYEACRQTPSFGNHEKFVGDPFTLILDVALFMY